MTQENKANNIDHEEIASLFLSSTLATKMIIFLSLFLLTYSI